ncbi:MAG: Arsenic resistance transcriptional regulator ArsR1 [Candidatus Celerinatantimonas neptuna]|nr:MAG: Arsenic resistance transcriptional regulator ArsR1 [Candidatus Celerinatantimonas neptuna]
MTPLTLFKCLADETRLKSLLLISLQQELCVCDLQAVLDVSQPKISRHLAELRKCQLLIDERRGKWVYYRLHPQLPPWSVEILVITARNNTDFLKESLNHFKHAGCGTNCEK